MERVNLNACGRFAKYFLYSKRVERKLHRVLFSESFLRQGRICKLGGGEAIGLVIAEGYLAGLIHYNTVDNALNEYIPVGISRLFILLGGKG